VLLIYTSYTSSPCYTSLISMLISSSTSPLSTDWGFISMSIFSPYSMNPLWHRGNSWAVLAYDIYTSTSHMDDQQLCKDNSYATLRAQHDSSSPSAGTSCVSVGKSPVMRFCIRVSITKNKLPCPVVFWLSFPLIVGDIKVRVLSNLATSNMSSDGCVADVSSRRYANKKPNR
jgi:hypothetical protein